MASSAKARARLQTGKAVAAALSAADQAAAGLGMDSASESGQDTSSDFQPSGDEAAAAEAASPTPAPAPAAALPVPPTVTPAAAPAGAPLTAADMAALLQPLLAQFDAAKADRDALRVELETQRAAIRAVGTKRAAAGGGAGGGAGAGAGATPPASIDASEPAAALPIMAKGPTRALAEATVRDHANGIEGADAHAHSVVDVDLSLGGIDMQAGLQDLLFASTPGVADKRAFMRDQMLSVLVRCLPPHKVTNIGEPALLRMLRRVWPTYANELVVTDATLRRLLCFQLGDLPWHTAFAGVPDTGGLVAVDNARAVADALVALVTKELGEAAAALAMPASHALHWPERRARGRHGRSHSSHV